MQRIAVIGGGAAAAAVVGEFLRREKYADEIALTWLTGHQSPGRGIAYATRSDQHLLNVRAANMGLFADDTGALLRFARSRGMDAKTTDFLPRNLFGEFVESTLGRLRTRRGNGCRLDVRPAEAVAAGARAGGGYTIQTDAGTELSVDALVLAVGAPPAMPLPQVQADALRSGGYVLDPWAIPRPIRAPQHVMVLGSGLTAADVILTVAETWPRAKITALSRHGCLPASHQEHPGATYPRQAELIGLLRAQPDARRWFGLIRATIAADAVDWRSVVDGLRPATVELWQALDASQRRRFLRHARWLWESARHRMAPQTAVAIQQLRDAGSLDLIAGRVRRVDGKSRLQVTFSRRGDASERTRGADLVIQATGFENATTHTSHSLLRQLFESGLARIDPHGLGLHTTSAGHALRADGSAAPDFRVIGTLLRNALWECTAMPEIRTMAARLVRELPEDLQHQRIENARRCRETDSGSLHIDMPIGQYVA